MEPSWEIAYVREVIQEDLPEIPRNMRDRILRAIDERLGAEPRRYGVRLRRSLAGLWKLRVGDYRVIYGMEGRRVVVELIGHRRWAYEEIGRRMARKG